MPNRIAESDPRIATARTPAGSSGIAQRSAMCSATAAARPIQTQPGQNTPAPVAAQTIVTTSASTAETADWMARAGLPPSAGIGGHGDGVDTGRP